MREIENRMVIDSHWREREKQPKIISDCAGCQENIHTGEAVYEFDDYGQTVLIHQNMECCMSYIAEMSICKVAGEE